MQMSPEQEALIERVFETYLTDHHHGDLLQLTSQTDEEAHQPVVVNAMTLFEANMEVGDYFNAYPNDVLAIFDKVLYRTAMELSRQGSPKACGGQGVKEQRMRHIPHARITGLPVCPELTRDTIPRSRDVGHFLSVTGTVIRTSVTKVLEYKRDYMCTKCRHVFEVQADFDQFYTFVPPLACPNPDCCNSSRFSCLSDGSEPAACRDYQEIKIQEQVQRLSVGCIPRSMVVVLEDDLVDGCKSGDDVTVYGVMDQRWKPFSDGSRCDVELVLRANNIEVNNQQAAAALLMKDVQKDFEDFWDEYKQDPLAGRNQILLSLCPQVFGMYVIKLAVAMVMAGGVQRIDPSGTKIRGECHMLLVGDPGTGKSQFLKYAAKVMPRSVLTAGIGSTSAGLTVAAVKDGGDWHLEAGALVLADGGLCCIDEFNSIKEHDRISIHEAMEQQSISVAKAGMVCKLNTRTTILAAANPKGQYDSNEPLSVNVALASPLLSRFDLVLVLLDTKNPEWDRVISSFILEDRGLPVESAGLWAMEKMKAYFSVIKHLKPLMSQDANSILSRYYQLQRQSDGRNAARTTIRMLESLSRLAEAHARLMYRETVTIEDAVMAVCVMECSMQGGALLGSVNTLLTSFPAEPGHHYATQCELLLEGLNLPHLIHKERDRLARLRMDIPERSPVTENDQHPLGDTNSIHNTHRSTDKGMENVSVDGGLDWFTSITPSVLTDAMVSPILTSTQDNRTERQNTSLSETSIVPNQPNCQTERNRKRDKDENKIFLTQEKSHQSESQSDKNSPEASGYVFQKVSKSLRKKRLSQLGLNDEQCDTRGGGGHRETMGLGEGASKHVTGGLDTTLESPNSSSLLSAHFPSNSLVDDSMSPGKEARDEKQQTGIKNLREKMTAEIDNKLHAKFSDFIFKPKKMRHSAHSPSLEATSSVSAEFQTERSPSARDPHTSTGKRQGNHTPLVEDDSPGPHASTGKNKRKKGQNHQQNPLDMKSTSEQMCRVSEIGDSMSEASFHSKALDQDVPSLGKDKPVRGQTVGRIKSFVDDENMCQQQKTEVNPCGEDQVVGLTDSPPTEPSISINDPTTCKLGHTKPTVTSSTLAKLSRYSFTSTAEPTSGAQTQAGKNPPITVQKSPLTRDGAGLQRMSSEDNVSRHSNENRPSGQTMKSFGKVKDILRPRATELKPGQKHEHGTLSLTETMSKSTAEHIKPTHASINSSSVKMVNNAPVDYQKTVNMKRKCFELGNPPSTVTSPFSGLSLFSSTELSNDVVDTDWDQEVSKKAKI